MTTLPTDGRMHGVLSSFGGLPVIAREETAVLFIYFSFLMKECYFFSINNICYSITDPRIAMNVWRVGYWAPYVALV